MVTEVSIKETRIFPEYFMRTYGESLPDGSSNLFRLKGIGSKAQMLKVLSMNFDPLASVKVQQIVDQIRRQSMNTLQLPGTGVDIEVFGNRHALEFVEKEYIINGQNGTGGASADYRANIQYIVDSLDTLTKMNLSIALNDRDKSALEILKKVKANGGAGIDVEEAFRIGVAVPNNYEEFMKLNQIQGTIIDTLPDATTLGTTRSEILNSDVENPGEQEYVLQALYIQKPAQAQVGEATIHISRDADDDVLEFDPACITNSLARIPLHIHALENIKVEASSTTANQTTYKATAVVTKRKIGLGFKAKMLEFNGRDNLPDRIKFTDEELAEIESKHLLEIARTGIIPIG